MSQDSIGVVTTGTMKATGMEDNSETKPLPQIERHSYSEVGWISRQILSASGRGRTFFLTSLFIELIDPRAGLARTPPMVSVNACSIRGDVKNILLPPPEARVWFAASSPLSDRSDARVLCLALWFGVLLCSISAAACSLVATTPIGF